MVLSDPVQLALIAAFSATLALISPLFLAWLTNRHRMREKIEDYARQDRVAAAALEAASKVEAKLAKTSVETNKKLDVIHVLVNSSMTAAMQSELDALRSQRAMMNEIIELKKKAGLEPGLDAVESLRVIDKRINELQANITGRIEKAALVDAKP